MPATKEQIRQIIADNDLNSVADVYSLLKDSFKDILQELMEAELDASLGYEKCQRRFKNVRKRRLYFVVFRRSHVTFSSVSLLKKCVYDLLLLTHEFLAFFQPV